MVRIHPDPPVSYRGCSSVGRAPALQAGGHRFDPVHLHHFERERSQGVGRSGCLNSSPERSQVSPAAYFWSLTGEAVRSLTIRKKQVHRSPKIDAWVVIAFKTASP